MKTLTWQQRNPGKVRRYKQAWYQRHKDEQDARSRDWHRANPDWQKSWVRANMGKVLEYNRNYYQQLKRQVFTHYSNLTCAECGCADYSKLSIDHVNGGGSKHRRELGFNSSYQFYFWLKRNNYPEGYRVLCKSCNSSHQPRRK